MHFLFEDKLLSLKNLLLPIIPLTADLKWSVDKEEIARVWNFLHVLHTNVTKVAMEFGMHHGTALGTSEEVLLNPSFMADVVLKKDGRQLPLLKNRLHDPKAHLQVAPTHEIRLMSFKHLWFLANYPFLKCIPVMRESGVTSFFIRQIEMSKATVRFSITCLPHAHLNPFEVRKRHTGFDGGYHYQRKMFSEMQEQNEHRSRRHHSVGLEYNQHKPFKYCKQPVLPDNKRGTNSAYHFGCTFERTGK